MIIPPPRSTLFPYTTLFRSSFHTRQRNRCISLFPRGCAPRTPLHALSRAASPARSVRVAHSLALVRAFMRGLLVLPERLRPSDSPTRSLARRFAGAFRSRGSLASARSRLYERTSSLTREASPLGLPYTLSRAPLRRRAPFAWLTR